MTGSCQTCVRTFGRGKKWQRLIIIAKLCKIVHSWEKAIKKCPIFLFGETDVSELRFELAHILIQKYAKFSCVKNRTYQYEKHRFYILKKFGHIFSFLQVPKNNVGESLRRKRHLEEMAAPKENF